MYRKQVFITVLLLVSILVSGCAPSAEQAATMTASAWTATPQPTATFTAVPPTATLQPIATPIAPTPTLAQESSGTLISIVRIVNHESIPPTGQQLWLEFAFTPGDILPGSEIEATLNNGTLELVFPGGETKTFARVPHSPTEEELQTDIWLPEGIGISTSSPPAGALPINGMSFENYTDAPNGPQIRIAIENLPDLTAIGQYQISWQSGDLHSNKIVFDWDGKEITVK